MDRPSSSSQSGLSNEASGMNGDFISLGEALKLVPLFKENKQPVAGVHWECTRAAQRETGKVVLKIACTITSTILWLPRARTVFLQTTRIERYAKLD